MKSLKILFLYFLFIIFSLKIVYAYTEPNDSNDIEKLLIKSLYEIADGNLNNAGNQSIEKLNDLKEEARQRIKSHLKTGFSSVNSTIRTTLPDDLQKIIYIDTSNSRLFIQGKIMKGIKKLLSGSIH